MATQTFDDEFDSLSGTWHSTWPGSPGGTSLLSAWFPNPSLVPADGNPVSINNGSLDLANYPRPDDVSADLVGGQSRIGGQVNTSGSFSQTYGYFEVRAQLPSDPGYLGAIWMLPANPGGTYSELDIAEVVSRAPSTLTYNVWRPEPDGGYVDVANTSQGFHTYAVDWEPDNITWYFDGQQIAQTTTPSYMNQPMFMILSNESGTNDSWGGAPDSGSSSHMLVDYVRAYNANPTNGGTLTFQSSSNDTTTSSASTNTSTASGSTDSTTPATTGSTTALASTDNTTAVSGSTDNSTTPATTDTNTTTTGGSLPDSGSNGSSNIVDLASGVSRISATSAADMFVINGSDHHARISDFTPGIDKLGFGITAQDFSNVSIDTTGRGWAVIEFDGNRIYLPGVTPSELNQSDFLFSSSQQ
jgi:beta-glucanase (GH16 family)